MSVLSHHLLYMVDHDQGDEGVSPLVRMSSAFGYSYKAQSFEWDVGECSVRLRGGGTRTILNNIGEGVRSCCQLVVTGTPDPVCAATIPLLLSPCSPS